MIRTTEEYVAKAKSLWGDKYDYSKTVYYKSRLPVEIVCKEHGPFTISAASSHIRKHRNGCKACMAESLIKKGFKLKSSRFLKHITVDTE